MKPLLIVDCYLSDMPGAPYYARWIQRCTVSWRASHGTPPPALEDFSGIIVTGSKACLSAPEPWMPAVIEFVREAIQRDIPLLGCCFGHQILAIVADGPEAVFETEVAEVGYLPIQQLRADPLLDPLGSTFTAFVTHGDAVRPSDTFDVLARSAACPVHALRIRGARAWGVQFHVEYPPEEQDRILRYRAVKHPDLGLDPDRLLAEAPDTGAQAALLFGAFEEQC